MENRKISCLIPILLGLVACGGGGGSSSPQGANTLSGVALDGYLYKAIVCLDLNDNFLCDPTEPGAITDEQGKYTLAGVSDQARQVHSILINAVAGVTVDQDSPGVPIARSYFLTAPAGETTITPFTTLIKADMVVNKVDAFTARFNIGTRMFGEALRRSLNSSGTSVESMIGQDYIAEGNSTLRKLGAAIISDNIVFEPSFLNTTSVAEIEKYFQTSFSNFWSGVASYVAPNIDSIDSSLTVSAARAVVSNAVASGLPDFREGVSEVSALDSQSYRVRTTRFVPGGATYTFLDNYAIQGPVFVSQAPVSNGYWELKDSVWSPVNTSIVDGGGAYGVTGREFGSAGVRFLVDKVSLEGKSFDFSSLNRSGISQSFPAGSTGYFLSYVTKTPRYILSGPALTNSLQIPLESIDALVAEYPSSATPSWVNAFTSRIGLSFTFSPTGASAGTLSFRDPNVPSRVAVNGGSYLLLSQGGQRILAITEIPETALQAIASFNPTASSDYKRGVRPFFSVDPDGAVREGVYTPVSVASSSMPLLNRAALNSVLQALSLCQLSASYEDHVSCPPI